MSVYALADLHLCIGVPSKSMEIFGWSRYVERMQESWSRLVKPDDLVLIPGDISWAKETQDALPDLQWIDALPGTKLLLKGNHDYWWSSFSKVKNILPPSLHLIQNNVFLWNDYAIGGSRLWDTPEYSFDSYIEYTPQPEIPKKSLPPMPETPEEQEKIYVRELARLEASLKLLPPSAKVKIALTHYPPIGPLLAPSRASAILEKYRINLCVFGHLHNVARGQPLFGEKNGVRYVLTAADHLEFKPLKVFD